MKLFAIFTIVQSFVMGPTFRDLPHFEDCLSYEYIKAGRYYCRPEIRPATCDSPKRRRTYEKMSTGKYKVRTCKKNRSKPTKEYLAFEKYYNKYHG